MIQDNERWEHDVSIQSFSNVSFPTKIWVLKETLLFVF